MQGVVVVSYFEWVQNRYGNYWPADEVERRLNQQMTFAFKEVIEIAKIEKCTLRQAAYIIAVHRVVEAEKLRGTIK